MAGLGGVVTKDLWIINAFAAELPAGAVPALANAAGVRWVSFDAPMRSATVDTETVRDEFNTEAYTGNDGTANWSDNWTEVDNGDDASGLIQANSSSFCASPFCLRFGKNGVSWGGKHIAREADLSDASTATLTFSYRGRKDDTGNAAVTLQVSADGGGSWTNLATYNAGSYHAAQIPQSFDVSPHIAANTQIRFLGSGQADGSTIRIYFDNVQIEFY